MTLSALKKEVWEANQFLASSGLVILTWGNVSGIHRSEGLIVIKPSGVPYHALTENDMIVVDMQGRIVEGTQRPSSDTPTHLELYKAFPDIGGVTHTHSLHATMFAQACREIPCLGTTHADTFAGPVPVTRMLREQEVALEYEKNTGTVIVERFLGMNPSSTPAVLVAGHGPFCWGKSATESAATALILEQVAAMASGTMQIAPGVRPLPDFILQKHYQRKHGPAAYYGQK